MEKGLVSVILPVYNAASTIKESLVSVCNQTYTKLEIIVINDGSTDNSLEVIKEIAKNDGRIKIINKNNEGLIKGLNQGLSLANGEYIARMDADDLCYADRIEKQVKYLNKHLDIGLLGTAVKTFQKTNHEVSFLSDSNQIRLKLFFQNEFAHPSVMIRHQVLLDNELKYNDRYLHVEDYGLWSSISRISKVSNLKTPLLHYRVSDSSVSALATKKILERNEMHFRIYRDNFDLINLNYTDEDLSFHRAISGNSPYYFNRLEHFSVIESWFLTLEEEFKKLDGITDRDIQRVLSLQFYNASNKFTSLGLLFFAKYMKTKWSKSVGFKNNLRLFLKSFMKYKAEKAIPFDLA
ncbi:glycosyltransferase family 2 protein [Sphingobacterium daejeonense]|uniref:Glycosyltransferase family 2 protein n=1 Tax=Sphingobacterium daejeonense TaxID=371142 RepID=A0ABW3RNC8_9SPHI